MNISLDIFTNKCCDFTIWFVWNIRYWSILSNFFNLWKYTI